MNKEYLKCYILVITFCGFSVSALASQNAGQLQHNPFSQPKLMVESPSTNKSHITKNEMPITLDLRAIIVSKSMPMVNLGGEIMTVGEEVGGLRLLSVSEGEAVFLWNGTRHTLIIGSNKLEER